MRVSDPDRQTWRVSRRWVPWRRRVRVHDVPAGEALLGIVDDHHPGRKGFVDHGFGQTDDALTLAFRLVGLLLLVPFMVLSLLAVVELLLVLLVLPLAVLGRVLLGRHWVVEVRADLEPVWETDAGGWAESGEAIRDIGDALQRGDCPWHPSAAHPRRGRVLQDWILTYAALDPAPDGPAPRP